jgi:two-component system LytT family response regulator
VTAHDRYAIKAFDVHAQDYLLKPFDPDRLVLAFRRAAERLRERKIAVIDARLQALLEQVERDRRQRTRIAVRDNGRVRLLLVSEVDWIESSDNNVILHVGAQVHSLRQTMQRLEESLSPTQFVRVHRTAIVNVARIREIQPWFSGEYVVILRDGTRVRTSRGYRSRLEALMT